MQIEYTEIPDLCVLKPAVHSDDRGFFVESWREEWGSELGLSGPFIQDNHARSEQVGVLRGLHYQVPPHAQSKLIWATRGAIYDVAVDIRRGSPTYGAWHGLILSEANKLRFFVPRGFAHGYMTLEPGTEVNYKVDAYYSPAHEGGVRYDDPALGIPWPGSDPVLSLKDTILPFLHSIDSPFVYNGSK